MFSRAAKQQGFPALERENDETPKRVESEKSALPVVLVNITYYVQQFRSRRRRKTDLAGVKPVINKPPREVQKRGVPASGRIDNNIYTVRSGSSEVTS